MKKDWAMLWGWGAGVFAAATAIVAVYFLETGGRQASADILQMILFSVVLGAGPGLLLLSIWISSRLKRRHASGAGRGSTLALGTLVGATAGLPAVLLGPVIIFGPEVLRGFTRGPEGLFMLALGVVSGATTGFTCAWRVSVPRES